MSEMNPTAWSISKHDLNQLDIHRAIPSGSTVFHGHRAFAIHSILRACTTKWQDAAQSTAFYRIQYIEKLNIVNMFLKVFHINWQDIWQLLLCWEIELHVKDLYIKPIGIELPIKIRALCHVIAVDIKQFGYQIVRLRAASLWRFTGSSSVVHWRISLPSCHPCTVQVTIGHWGQRGREEGRERDLLTRWSHSQIRFQLDWIWIGGFYLWVELEACLNWSTAGPLLYWRAL